MQHSRGKIGKQRTENANIAGGRSGNGKRKTQTFTTKKKSASCLFRSPFSDLLAILPFPCSRERLRFPFSVFRSLFPFSDPSSRSLWLLPMLCILLLTGCSKYTLSVRQEKVDASYLASSQVGTPDRRQADPPLGQKLVIDWRIPQKVLEENPYLVLSLIFKNYTEEKVSFPIKTRIGQDVYFLLGEAFKERKGILTYRAEIFPQDGPLYKEWKHQLWVNLITE